MTAPDFLTAKLRSDLCGRALEASIGFLALGVRARDDQSLNNVVNEGPNMLVLKQFPLTKHSNE